MSGIVVQYNELSNTATFKYLLYEIKVFVIKSIAASVYVEQNIFHWGKASIVAR